MSNERRRSPRVKVNLQARWEGVLAQQEATITDLSRTGCFVLTGGKVEPKELVRLEMEIPGGDPLVLWGEVVEAAYDIGFAVKFTSMTDDDELRLRRFITSLLTNTV
ncbi:MAG TPA: PilZ domain-containing protein [Pyrinomonadaceae bacterium]|nr:PilZ domain-containing protein [Pyrinomonadaceae bacterium]